MSDDKTKIITLISTSELSLEYFTKCVFDIGKSNLDWNTKGRIEHLCYGTEINNEQVMICCLSDLTFKNDIFYDSSVNKICESYLTIMFYDKVTHNSIHNLMNIYMSCLKRNETPKVIILIDVKNTKNSNIDFADQISDFESIMSETRMCHMSIDPVSDISSVYSIIEMMIES